MARTPRVRAEPRAGLAEGGEEAVLRAFRAAGRSSTICATAPSCAVDDDLAGGLHTCRLTRRGAAKLAGGRACSSSTSWNSRAWTSTTRGISVSTSWPCSPADSTTSRPQPRIRSSTPCENETSLIRASGKSRPLPGQDPRAQPQAAVGQLVGGRPPAQERHQREHQARARPPPRRSRAGPAPCPPSAGRETSATMTAAMITASSRTGRSTVFQCGCSRSTMCSPSVRPSS